MEIGAKLRQARLDAGLSQRELCRDIVTRNMLSQIENGSARPSMDTLIQFASRLGKPVSFFLDEDGMVSSNASCMEQARQAYGQGNLREAEACLQAYQRPDAVFDQEYGLLKILILLSKAEEEQSRPAYARELLEQAEQIKTCYFTPELEQRRLLLLAQVSQDRITLPVDDRPLLYRAKTALEKGDAPRCKVLLEACEDQHNRQWRYLRAEAAFQMQQYEEAIEHYPPDCYARLEECYRNLGDYKMAYEYACKQR